MIIMKSLDLVIKMYVCVKKIYACLTVACYELKTTKTTKKQISYSLFMNNMCLDKGEALHCLNKTKF